MFTWADARKPKLTYGRLISRVQPAHDLCAGKRKDEPWCGSDGGRSCLPPSFAHRRESARDVPDRKAAGLDAAMVVRVYMVLLLKAGADWGALEPVCVLPQERETDANMGGGPH
jgi:hypothetical protein